MFSKLLPSERVLIEMDHSVLVKDASWVVVIKMAVLALESNHLAIFFKMFLQVFQIKFVKVPTETFERIPRAF